MCDVQAGSRWVAIASADIPATEIQHSVVEIVEMLIFKNEELLKKRFQ